jgi:hypothetical protein
MIEKDHGFNMAGWSFRIDDVTEVIEPEISIEEALEQVKQLNKNSLTTKKTMAKTATNNSKKESSSREIRIHGQNS